MGVRTVGKRGAIRLSLEMIIMIAIGIAVTIGLFFLVTGGIKGPAESMMGFAQALNVNLTRLW